MKKTVIGLVLSVILISFGSCKKDGGDSGLGDLIDSFQSASVKITKDGTEKEYKFTIVGAIGKSNVTTVTMSSTEIALYKPSLLAFEGSAVGTYTTDMSAEGLLSFDLDKILENTVIVYLSEEEYVLMTKGSIKVTGFTTGKVEGTFEGTGINAKNITDLDITTIEALLLNQPYKIVGTFNALKASL